MANPNLFLSLRDLASTTTKTTDTSITITYQPTDSVGVVSGVGTVIAVSIIALIMSMAYFIWIVYIKGKKRIVKKVKQPVVAGEGVAGKEEIK
jgi:hypothetical protein